MRSSSECSVKVSLPRLKTTQHRLGALARSVHTKEERIGRMTRYQDVVKVETITKKYKADNTSLRKAKQFKIYQWHTNCE